MFHHFTIWQRQMHLAATDASGGVVRPLKIMHVHESPFYHFAQFPHPFVITYCGKKYSRILFGQAIDYVLIWRFEDYSWC
jgi:hypothetical protein